MFRNSLSVLLLQVSMLVNAVGYSTALLGSSFLENHIQSLTC